MHRKALCIVYLANGEHCFAARYAGDDLAEFDNIVFQLERDVNVSDDTSGLRYPKLTSDDREAVRQEVRLRGIAFVHGLS